ncbi:hypothetical protein ACYFX5_05280 [Bremerella sp. T1]|uniref:hypothetical protein n=1 Tax=Bremerella sp. TYQ1 TaxID=3119568 RepID=UPI001CCA8E3B|nr:hypothetical protein [Bremerella volcania]UBM37671.1 hypothetical protein LA756_07225 [Bremerella volcania]
MHKFTFENNTGSETFTDETLPLTQPLVTDSAVVTNDAKMLAPNAGFDAELAFLKELKFGDCAYGAARCPIYPFICRVRGDAARANAQMVLDSLGCRWFRSKNIDPLASATIPYPGYSPGDLNDEIHNDYHGQVMFSKRHEDEGSVPGLTGPIPPDDGPHGQLYRFVRDFKLWYVLLHSWSLRDSLTKQPWVVVFTIGLSRDNDALIGGVSHQLCHNLCD